MNYQEFVQNKKHLLGEFGFEPNYIPDIAFDFQKHIIEKAVRKGRIAIFADTGLGKTLIQLSIAKNVVNHTNKPVLILTPLAVAFQFLLEAEKLGIDDIEYSKDGNFTKNIVFLYVVARKRFKRLRRGVLGVSPGGGVLKPILQSIIAPWACLGSLWAALWV